LLLVHEEETAIARKEDQKRRRTERERAKAQRALDATGDIPDEDDYEREERHAGTVCQLLFFINHSHSTQSKFTSQTVPSKPSNLIRHTKKVPPSSSPITASALLSKP
jgi:hypothetical protein